MAGGGGVLAFPGAEPLSLNPLLQAVGGGRVTGAVGEVGGESIGTTTDADLDHPLFAGVFDQPSPNLERPDVRRAARYVPGGGERVHADRPSGGAAAPPRDPAG